VFATVTVAVATDTGQSIVSAPAEIPKANSPTPKAVTSPSFQCFMNDFLSFFLQRLFFVILVHDFYFTIVFREMQGFFCVSVFATFVNSSNVSNVANVGCMQGRIQKKSQILYNISS
jgi:hypothetical protein